MEPFKVLIELGLLDWSCIWLGFNRGWVSRENVYDYAISLLEGGEFSENVAILAGGRYLDEKEFESLCHWRHPEVCRPVCRLLAV